MKEAQGYKCAVCRQDPEPTRGKHHKWAVDHDHKTGMVRGLAWRHCNSMLGYSKDDPETLRLGAEYLEEHHKKRPEQIEWIQLTLF